MLNSLLKSAHTHIHFHNAVPFHMAAEWSANNIMSFIGYISLYQVHVIKARRNILLHKGFKIEFKGGGRVSEFKVLENGGM